MYIKRDGLNDVKKIVLRNISKNGYTEEQFFDERLDPHVDQLDEAVAFARNWMMLNDNEPITIVGDYDVDGITSTDILYEAFKKINRTPVTRLPRRFSEGYGLSEKIIDEIAEGLLITVDNGIAALPAIKKAKAKGLSVIVIDHHLPVTGDDGKIILPPADVILDPHVYPEKSEFVDYCGAGLAYRFAKKLLPNLKLIELLNLASLGTVADVMPLYGANRQMVIKGLEALNKNKVIPGLNALINKLGFDGHQTEMDYGFKLGPIFNASGRLYDNGAERVLRLLKLDRDDPKLMFKVNNVINTNEQRKEIAKNDTARVYDTLDGTRPIVVYDENIGEGIIGLVAGRLTEDFYCPSIVFTKTEKVAEDGDVIIKGSGRSIPEIHLKNVLDKIKDKIEGYGGHAGAAGLSIRLSRLDEFKQAFIEACGEIPELSTDVYYDIEIEPEKIPEVVEQLKRFAPYGEGNPRVSIRMRLDVSDYEYHIIGDGTHFMLKNEDANLTIMGFGMVTAYEKAEKPTKLDCIGYMSEHWYNKKMSYKFELVSFSE